MLDKHSHIQCKMCYICVQMSELKRRFESADLGQGQCSIRMLLDGPMYGVEWRRVAAISQGDMNMKGRVLYYPEGVQFA